MIIFVVTLLILEAVNIAYTGAFGLADPMDQPLRYGQVRFYLRFVTFVAAIATALGSLSTNIYISFATVAAPFVIEGLLFKYCKMRERRRLTALYMRTLRPGDKRGAKEVASLSIDTITRSNKF